MNFDRLNFDSMTLERSLLMLCLAVSPCAFADDKSSHAAMDSDGNGRVSATEHAAGARRMFEQMDADRDGIVTATEMRAAHASLTGKKPDAGEMSAEEKIKVIDADGDGQLTAAEHAAGSESMFAKMDTDANGVLTATEIEEGHARMMRRK